MSLISQQSDDKQPFKLMHALVNINKAKVSSQDVSSSGLAVKHPAPGAKYHRFDPSKRLKLFQRLISGLTTSWVGDHVK